MCVYVSHVHVHQKVLSRHTLTTSVEDTYELCDNPSTLNIVMMKKDLSFILILIISIISGLRIRINNLRKRGKELVNI